MRYQDNKPPKKATIKKGSSLKINITKIGLEFLSTGDVDFYISKKIRNSKFEQIFPKKLRKRKTQGIIGALNPDQGLVLSICF